MARHHAYSKRSRESRKAMNDSASARLDHLDPDDDTADDWHSAPAESDSRPPTSR